MGARWRALLAGLWLAPALWAGDRVLLRRYQFEPAAGEPAIPERLRVAEDGPGQAYKLIHLNQPMNADLARTLAVRGVVTLSYVPENAFVVRVGNAAALDDLPFVDWVGDYQPAYKIHPAVGRAEFASAERRALGFVLHVSLHPGAPMKPVRQAMRALGGEVLAEADAGLLQRFEVRFAGPEEALVEALARLPDVAWIVEKGERALRNDRARWIVQSYDDPGAVSMATPAYDNGLRGKDEVIGLIDGTLDLDHCLFADTAVAQPGPDHRKVVYFSGVFPASFHGAHVGGTLAGQREDGSLDDAGVAYEARVAFTEWFGNQSGLLFNTLQTHAQEGAFLHSNSWGEVDGSPVATEYTVDCVDIDAFSWQNEDHLVVFAMMNDLLFPLGPALSPENAINVLAVGATEMSAAAPQPHLLAERHGSSRRGPTVLDGRRKPEIFAPGVTLSSAFAETPCAAIDQGGTSMATPVVTGAAALVRQYFRDGYYPSGAADPARAFTPSGALIKAVLINGAVNMREESENQPGVFSDLPVPNNVEGWGRLNLDRSLHFAGDPGALQVRDVRNANGLSTGESLSWLATVADAGQPLRATMAFTGPPAALAALFPVINDLDLKVTAPDGTVYWGNHWDNGASIAGAVTDPLNNVESILLPAPQAGTYQFEVFARAVNIGRQGFAIAISGGLQCGCDEAEAEAGADIALACWGDQAVLGGLGVCAAQGTVSWTPTEGLSDPAALFPTARPLQTTTYTLTVDLGGGCVKTDQVTVTVPEMDIDDDGALTAADFTAAAAEWLAGGVRDYNGNGLVDVLDLVRLAGCVAAAP